MEDSKIKAIKQLDLYCCEANSLWIRLENFKEILIERFGISQSELERHNIFFRK